MNISSPARPVRFARTQWLLSALVAVMVAALMVAVPDPAGAASNYDNVDQVLASNFVDAGVAISEANYDPATTDAVVLATDANFPDGLTASAVAAFVGGPVLFTQPNSLPQATADEIDRLLDAGDTVYVMGGTAAVGDAVTAELDPPYTVQRISGATRLETAVAAMDLVGVPSSGTVIIARAFGPDGANTTSDRTTGWVDAISCGAYAAANNIPILLTETGVLSGSTRTALEASDATDVIICGGTAAVGSAVADALRGLGLDVDRVDGVTRVETAIAAAQELFGFATAGGNQYTVINGYGENFGYGLDAAPLGDPILLVGTAEPTDCADTSQPSRQTLCYLGTGTANDPANLLVMGSEAVIRDEVSNAAGDAAGGVPSDDVTQFPALPAPADVDATDDIDDDGTRATVTWDAVADPDDILAGYNVYVDGVRQGGEPTVNGTTLSYVLTGLTPDEEVSVTVTTWDGVRESDPSAASLVTPTDEAPAANAGFNANPGNGEVVLTWDRGPADTKSYLLERSANATCPGGTYAEIETITNEATVTYTDSEVTNGTAYCYKLTITDDADQEGEAADAGPATPNVGTPQVSIQSPVGGSAATRDTVHYGPPLVIEYTVTDTDTDPDDLIATWEVSYDGGTTYGVLLNGEDLPVDFESDTDDGPATFAAAMCPVDDSTSTNCIRDAASDEMRLRVTIDDGTTGNRQNTGDLDMSRTPPPVENLAVIGGAGAVTLEWDRMAAGADAIPSYTITRLQVRIQDDDEDAGSETCTTALGSYTEVASPTQPAASQDTVSYNDPVDEGDGFSDFLYCYRVVANRGDGDGGSSAAQTGAGNPIEAPGVGVAIQDPANNGSLGRGDTEVIKYKLDIPDGATVDSVELWYCANYDTGNGTPLDPASCDSPGGFQNAAGNGLIGTPPAADGTNSVQWVVPEDATTSQGDGQTGALEIRVTATGAGGGTGRVIGILFT